VAREAAHAYGVDYRDPAAATAAAGDGGYPVAVDDPSGCDAFCALEVTGFDPSAPTPRWLARRVQLAGMRPISLAVDVTNYVMLELGQPIHGYDKVRLRGPIVVRRARADERLVTLDGVKRQLDAEDLLIVDDTGPIGLAGVMGGESTEISATTADIVIEAAHFDPVSVMRTARRHKLPSEASKRFERGVDPTLGPIAARRVADLLIEFGGGVVADTATVISTTPPRDEVVIAADLSSQIAGFDITGEQIVQSLADVGCRVSTEPGVVRALPPPWRTDLTDPYDLVEEVVRLIGYGHVPSVLPTAPAGRGLTPRQRMRRRVGIVLAAAGYVEVLSYPFVGQRDWDSLDLAADDPRRTTVRIANPLSDEEPLLRTTLLPGLLRALARNVGRAQADLGLYEIGSVFLPMPGDRPKAPRLGVDRRPTLEELKQLEAALPDQPLHIAVVVSGMRSRPGWWGPGSAAGWADAVQVCRTLAGSLGVDVDIVRALQAPWHPGRCGQVLVGETVAGYAGELHPRVCAAYGLPPRTAAAELDLEVLLHSAVDIPSAPDFSTYPVAKEDVALVVDVTVAAADVETALRTGAGPLLESARLFDVYTGEQIGSGKKSLAYALRFRAADRTLTEAEVRAAVDAAVASAAAETGAVQRM
jgi:phenylalanyl-tRNA synthetase beta chain